MLNPELTVSRGEGGFTLSIKPNKAAFPKAKKKEITISEEELRGILRWKNGELIQDALPDWPAEKRELLLSGMDANEFKEYLK